MAGQRLTVGKVSDCSWNKWHLISTIVRSFLFPSLAVGWCGMFVCGNILKLRLKCWCCLSRQTWDVCTLKFYLCLVAAAAQREYLERSSPRWSNIANLLLPENRRSGEKFTNFVRINDKSRGRGGGGHFKPQPSTLQKESFFSLRREFMSGNRIKRSGCDTIPLKHWRCIFYDCMPIKMYMGMDVKKSLCKSIR